MSEQRSQGRLKVFISYAAGVGKTFHMLVEGHRLRRDGIDVVIGLFNPHAYGRQDTIALARGLETIPTRIVESRGRRFTDMDTEAIIRRRPQLALVDELPHTNAPGSPRAKRWDDVLLLLDAGIDVTTTMNVTHLEGLRDQVWRSTGVRMLETVPDAVLQRANEIVMIDLPPQVLLQRLARGLIYPPARARAARQHFFKDSALAELRALALQQTSHVIESIEIDGDHADEEKSDVTASVPERLVVCIESDPASAALVRRAHGLARCLNAECYAVFVSGNGNVRELAPPGRDEVDRILNFARGLGMDVRILDGEDMAKTVVHFARLYDARHIFVLRPVNAGFRRMLARRSLVQRIVGLAPDVHVHIVRRQSGGADAADA